MQIVFITLIQSIKNIEKGRNITLKVYNTYSLFKKIKLLYLQYWSEPSFNPKFFNILKMAKEKECSVGTTNEMLLKIVI